MHRLKSIRTPPIPNCVREMSTKRRDTHYDILKIKTGATQNEIKSAYYELSKKYHPDVNQTVDAQDKFRKIREAYETLGSHDTRRNYDRMMSIRGAPLSSSDRGFTYTRTNITKDPRIRAYREEAESYGTGATGQHSFNYDMWARAHYGESLDRSMKLKSKYENLREAARKRQEVDEEEFMRKMDAKLSGPAVFFGLMLSLIAMSMIFRQNEYDQDLLNTKTKEFKDKTER